MKDIDLRAQKNVPDAWRTTCVAHVPCVVSISKKNMINDHPRNESKEFASGSQTRAPVGTSSFSPARAKFFDGGQKKWRKCFLEPELSAPPDERSQSPLKKLGYSMMVHPLPLNQGVEHNSHVEKGVGKEKMRTLISI